MAAGEGLKVEFKNDRHRLSDSELIETVACLANAEGGTLLVGVEDDGTVTGLHEAHRRGGPEPLAAFIASRTIPYLSVEATFVSLSEGIVAVIDIPMARQPVSTSDDRLLIRRLDSRGRPGCWPLYAYELPAWRADGGLADLSALVVTGASWADLDALEFERLRRMVREFRGDATLLNLADVELARALGLVQADRESVVPTVAGLLVVGKEDALREHVAAHEVAFQVLRGTDVLVNDFYRWPLLRIAERLYEAFDVRNEERELNIGMFRVPVPAYDQRAFREAVNNALTHRDYTRLGAVHVQLHDDHIEISNPGGFVQGVSPANVLTTEPRPRNPRLADIFKRVGLVERTGRGVALIYSGQLRTGHLPPDYSYSTDASVKVVLPGGPAELPFVQLIVTEENRRQRAFTVSELLALAQVWRERSIDVATGASLIQKTEGETRAVLAGLVEAGLLERRGSGRSQTYVLSASVYRTLGQPAAYIHAAGFDAEQMEQMILQYARAHGRITRREAADLCRVGSYQASRLLKRLARQGRLELHGVRKNSYYTLRSQL